MHKYANALIKYVGNLISLVKPKLVETSQV